MPPKHIPRERAWGTRYDTLGTSPSTPLSSPPIQPLQVLVDDSNTIGSTEEPRPVQEGVTHDASVFVGSLPSNIDHGELTKRLTEHLAVHSHIKAIKVVRDSRGGVCAFVQCDSPSSAADLLRSLQVGPSRPFLGRLLRFEPAKAFRTLLISYRIPPGFVRLHADGISCDSGDDSQNLGLAYAMRVHRSRQVKHLGLLYDEDALHFKTEPVEDGADKDGHDGFQGGGLLIHPLAYNADCLKKLVTAFGPLEYFREYAANTEEHARPYPSPHDATRGPEMAKEVWEIKWKDREDSVFALLTLRRVPYLTVSWAHHPPPSAAFNAGNHRTIIPAGLRNFRERQEDRYVVRNRLNYQLEHASPMHLRTTSSSTPSPAVKHESSASPVVRVANTTPSRVLWSDQPTELENSPLNTGLAGSPKGTHPIPGRHMTFTPRISLPGTTFHKGPTTPKIDYNLPQTPCSAMSKISVAGTCGSPVSQLSVTDDHVGPSRTPRGDGQVTASSRQWARDIDPTTIFVGGLEIRDNDSWDDHKLRGIFDRFGTILSVQVVKPLNKRTIFAFIKFADTTSATRAVQEEHNKTHDGQTFRVQLRDRNPRGIWRPSRGRGRNLFGGPMYTERDPSFGGPLGLGVDVFHTAHSPVVMSPDRRSASLFSPSLDRSPLQTGCDTITDRLVHPDLREISDAGSSSVSSCTTKVPSVHRGAAYEMPSIPASSTPPPSSSPTSATIPMTSYHMNMGFFQQSWAPPYSPSYPYAVPLLPGYGYAGYPYPPIHPMPQTLFAREPLNIPANTINSSVVDNPLKQESGSTESTPLHTESQPPLRATGFIQNMHGALVPVYQREALDQYMANAQRHPSHPPTTTSPSQPGSLMTPSCSGSWKPPPATLPIYPGGYPVGVHTVAPLPPSFAAPGQPPIWMSGPMPYGTGGFQPGHAVTAPFTAPQENMHRPTYTPSGSGHVAHRSTVPLNRFGRREQRMIHETLGMARQEDHTSLMQQ